MLPVLLTALALISSTLIGTAIGLTCKNANDRIIRLLNAIASGIMLHSVFFGLIDSALNQSLRFALPILLPGLFLGFGFCSLIELLSPKLLGHRVESGQTAALLFLLAMGFHNLPEGLAAGVSFGTGIAEDVITVAGGIALQNIPEGLILIPPLLSLGKCGKKAALISLAIALLEGSGVFLGYFAVTFSVMMLPLFLGFAAGAMLYCLLTDLIPSSCTPRGVYGALLGLSLMILLGEWI